MNVSQVPASTLLTSAPAVYPKIFPLVCLTTSTNGLLNSVTVLMRLKRC
jgi:hypothetical protein